MSASLTSRDMADLITMKSALLLLNCLLLAIGITAGPLVMRLYYLHGGKRIWLQAALETAGFPIMLFPITFGFYLRRRRRRRSPTTTAPLISITPPPPLILYSALIGLVAGSADYLYAYGVKHIPVSTSSLILATQLGFTACFAFFLVKQKFTPYSVNAVVLLTMGAAVLALHVSSDVPEGQSGREYYLGFFMTLAAAALFAVMLPLIELNYKKAGRRIDYQLVMEIQFVLSLSATVFCMVGMAVNNDFKAIQREAREYKLGKAMYYSVLIWSALIWQCFYLGAAGVIHYGSSLLSGIIIAVCLPVAEILAVVFYHEKFQVEKGVSLALSLWGFVSFFYGEIKLSKENSSNRLCEVVDDASHDSV